MTKTCKVYELVKPEMLRKIIPGGDILRIEQGIVIREPYWWWGNIFSSEKEALQVIEDNGKEYTEYVILPVFISTP